MSDDKNSIDEALGLRPLEEAKTEAEEDLSGLIELMPTDDADMNPVVVNNVDLNNDETLKDIELARQNVQDLIRSGKRSLDEAMELARQSENAKAFEAATQLLKVMLDANKDFVEVSTKKRHMREEILGPKDEETANVVNNTLVLTTDDLLKKIQGNNDEDGS